MATDSMTASPAFAGRSTQLAGFWDTLGSEWLKLISLRSTWLMLALGVMLPLGTAAIASVAMGASQSEWPERFHPATFSMVGNAFALIVYSVFGVMFMAGEYSSGMMRVTLISTPRRGRVLTAKFAILGLVVLAFGAITTLGMLLVTQVVLGAYGMSFTGLADSVARSLMLALAVTMPVFPLLGFAIATLVRNTAAGITAVLGLLWLPQILGEFLPMWPREHVLSLLPGSAVDSLTLGRLQYSPDYSDPALAVVITAAWLLAIVGAAYVSFTRRDA